METFFMIFGVWAVIGYFAMAWAPSKNWSRTICLWWVFACGPISWGAYCLLLLFYKTRARNK
jgi:hypothetical protein